MTTIVQFWILLCATIVASGWVLSAFHALNRVGYGIILGGFLIFCLWCVRQGYWSPSFVWHDLRKKIRRLWKRPAPCLFLVVAIMTGMAGALYVPNNPDTDAYRIPRVWHWLAEGQWHWIHTLDTRMNIADAGYEWLTAPLMLFTRTDRFIFIFNWIPYLLLPGLIFSLFTRLGVNRRVAWWWMWLLPAGGWCFAMQASSVVNDAFAAVYALAAMDLALRARQTGKASDIWLSLLSTALLTGAKQTNLPLLLPCVLVLLPFWKLPLQRPVATGMVLILAGLASVLPVTYFNLRHTGNWMGMIIASGLQNTNWIGCSIDSPFWGIIGNAFALPLQNLHPPVFLMYQKWNAAMEHFLASPGGVHFRSFEHFGLLEQGASESNAGLGMLLFLFIIVTAALVLRRGQKRQPDDRWLWLLRLAPWLALLAFMAKVGAYQNARHASPYYILLFPAILAAPKNLPLIKQRWWQITALLIMVFSALLLFVSRARPLFPAETILVPLKEKHPNWKFLSKAWDSFSCRLSVDQQRQLFKHQISPDEKIIGYFTLRGGFEPGMWLPFGTRKVYLVQPGETADQLLAHGIHYIITDADAIAPLNLTVQDLQSTLHASIASMQEIETTPPGHMDHTYLLHLDEAAKPDASTNSAPGSSR